MKNIIHQLIKNPRLLFLIDSLGAFLTAFFLFVIMRNFNEYIGMPTSILTYLSLIAACFCIYSTACFYFLKRNWAPFIIGISLANLMYSIYTISLLIFYYPLLTILGISYFLAEITLVLTLVYIELSAAKEIKQTKS